MELVQSEQVDVKRRKGSAELDFEASSQMPSLGP